MNPIAIFYHCLFYYGNPPELNSNCVRVAYEQMFHLRASGLLDAASHVVIGINGREESREVAGLILPPKGDRVYHGLESHNENLTICEMENFTKDHPGWHILYFHAKGATHTGANAAHRAKWRDCMTRHLVQNWQTCIADLQRFESVGCHWLTNVADGTQNIWAGNFFWARSEFLAILPPIRHRAQIRRAGITALESRFEAEVWIGNGFRLPTVRDYHPANPAFAPCP